MSRSKRAGDQPEPEEGSEPETAAGSATGSTTASKADPKAGPEGGESTGSSRSRLRRAGRGAGWAGTVLGLAAVWFVVAALIAVFLFLTSSRDTTVAGHDATVRPTLSGYAEVRPGALLPDVRMPLNMPVGVIVTLGKTEASSTQDLVDRYAFIASQPDAQIDKVAGLVEDMAIAAAIRGVVLGGIPVAVWLLLGRRRRRELLRGTVSVRGVGVVAALVAAGVLIVQPWDGDDLTSREVNDWEPLSTYLDGAVTLPAEAADLQIRADVTTAETQRLIESAISTYDTSQEFYTTAAGEAADLELRQPEEDETVVLLVSDRHDNIGMDPVARAIGDAGGASAVFDAGDDTSTGGSWESFSLDSLDDAFSDLDRYSVTGNHDNGTFVGDYLADRGWVRLEDGDIIEGPGQMVLMGADDPRSSGLGNWRDETGLTFDEVRDEITAAACDAEERIGTLLVHDAALGRDALAEGCVDLVVGGHIHVRSGPTPIEGENGEVGYTYTSGTTGGAAYAIAVGSKPRRPAETTLITYREGRPVGIQWVVLQTNGRFDVGEYVTLDYEPPTPQEEAEATESPLSPEDTASAADDTASAESTG